MNLLWKAKISAARRDVYRKFGIRNAVLLTSMKPEKNLSYAGNISGYSLSIPYVVYNFCAIYWELQSTNTICICEQHIPSVHKLCQFLKPISFVCTPTQTHKNSHTHTQTLAHTLKHSHWIPANNCILFCSRQVHSFVEMILENSHSTPWQNMRTLLRAPGVG